MQVVVGWLRRPKGHVLAAAHLNPIRYSSTAISATADSCSLAGAAAAAAGGGGAAPTIAACSRPRSYARRGCA